MQEIIRVLLSIVAPKLCILSELFSLVFVAPFIFSSLVDARWSMSNVFNYSLANLPDHFIDNDQFIDNNVDLRRPRSASPLRAYGNHIDNGII